MEVAAPLDRTPIQAWEAGGSGIGRRDGHESCVTVAITVRLALFDVIKNNYTSAHV